MSLICSISYKSIYQAICSCFDDAVCSLGLCIIIHTRMPDLPRIAIYLCMSSYKDFVENSIAR